MSNLASVPQPVVEERLGGPAGTAGRCLGTAVQ